MSQNRPVLISVIQYQEQLTAGTAGATDIVEAAHRLGADGAEFRPQFWRDTGHELPATRERAAQHGLLLTYATMGTLFSAEPGAADALRQDVDDACSLGSPQLRVFPGPLPADDETAGWAAGQEIVRYAAARGVTIALENYARTPGGTLAEIVRALDHIPELATNIDIGNYPRHGQDVPAAIRAVGSRAISAHLKDQGDPPEHESTHLGGGSLPLPAILDALDALPQRIIYCFEFGGGDDPDDRITRSIAYLHAR
jgi:sugar phosphate isomerase/epimerase